MSFELLPLVLVEGLHAAQHKDLHYFDSLNELL